MLMETERSTGFERGERNEGDWNWKWQKERERNKKSIAREWANAELKQWKETCLGIMERSRENHEREKNRKSEKEKELRKEGVTVRRRKKMGREEWVLGGVDSWPSCWECRLCNKGAKRVTRIPGVHLLASSNEAITPLSHDKSIIIKYN